VLRPMVRAGTRPVALATDATPQDTGHAKRSSDGARILILIFELKRGKAPNHLQVWHRCEIVNQFFGQTIDEVLFNTAEYTAATTALTFTNCYLLRPAKPSPGNCCIPARQLTEQLLRGIRTNRAKVVVIDITGVAAMDASVANHLVQTVEASRLLGATVIVTGLSPEIAQTLVNIGVDLGKMNTVGDLQGGIEQAERLLGYKVMPQTESN
jgi:anti-anti-sigma regulatory factor